MSLRSLLIVAPGALLLISALAFVFVTKNADHSGHDHSHAGHSHDHHTHAQEHSHDHSHDAHGATDTSSSPALHNHAAHSDEWRAAYADTPLPLVWKSLLAARAALLEGIGADSEAESLTRYAETIHLCAHALLEQVELPSATEQERLSAALSQTAVLADTLLDTLHHNERAAAHAALSRLDSAIGVATIRFPESFLNSAAQSTEAPVFASVPAHNHQH